MPEFMKVARTGDVAPGTLRVVRVGRQRLAIANVDGEFYAIEDVCTHDGGPLDQGYLEGYSVQCPRHGARFDVRDGSVLAWPAVVPVESYPLKVEGEDIYVAVD
jgi:3-phenylpropionate/trans-cinnamate dioxygenase ferredoxin subunit